MAAFCRSHRLAQQWPWTARYRAKGETVRRKSSPSTKGKTCSRGCLRGIENRCAASSYFSFLTSSWDVLELSRLHERSVAHEIFPLVSLMVDQVCSLQAHVVCAAILSGNTGVTKALLATERDIAQGKLRILFTAPGAIVGNCRWKQILLEYQIVVVTVYKTF